MSVPPSQSASVSVLDAQRPIRYVSREVLYLLWQWADTFQVELELERQLRLQGVRTLPPEWTAHLERERQLILDRLQWMESREEDSISLLGIAHNAHSAYTLPPTNPSYGGVGGRHQRSVPPPAQGHNFSRGLPHTVSPMRPGGGGRPFILPENEGNVGSQSYATPTASGSSEVGEDGLPPEAHTSLDSISSTDTDTAVSPDERIPQSPTIAPGSASVHHGNSRRGDSPQIASTRRGAGSRRVEQAGHRPRATMFNNAQNPTINGGIFYLVQGNLSHTSPTP